MKFADTRESLERLCQTNDAMELKTQETLSVAKCQSLSVRIIEHVLIFRIKHIRNRAYAYIMFIYRVSKNKLQ